MKRYSSSSPKAASRAKKCVSGSSPASSRSPSALPANAPSARTNNLEQSLQPGATRYIISAVDPVDLPWRRALEDPSTYPHPVRGLQVLETQISDIALTCD